MTTFLRASKDSTGIIVAHYELDDGETEVRSFPPGTSTAGENAAVIALATWTTSEVEAYTALGTRNADLSAPSLLLVRARGMEKLTREVEHFSKILLPEVSNSEARTHPPKKDAALAHRAGTARPTQTAMLQSEATARGITLTAMANLIIANVEKQERFIALAEGLKQALKRNIIAATSAPQTVETAPAAVEAVFNAARGQLADAIAAFRAG